MIWTAPSTLFTKFTTLLPDEKRRSATFSNGRRYFPWRSRKSTPGRCDEKRAPASLSNLNPGALLSKYKTRPRLIHVLPRLPLATGTIPKLDHNMPMALVKMAFIPKRQQKLAWCESLSPSCFPDSGPSLASRITKKKSLDTRCVCLCGAEITRTKMEYDHCMLLHSCPLSLLSFYSLSRSSKLERANSLLIHLL